MKLLKLTGLTLMLGLGVCLSPITYADQNVQGFSITNCHPLNNDEIILDFCSPKAIAIYKKQLNKPINYNHDYVMFPIDLPKPLKKWGKVTNYAALNPKTKKVIPTSFAFITEKGYARLSFNKNSNKVCTIDHNTVLMGDGESAGTYTPNSDGYVNYCFDLIDNQFFSTTLDFVP